MPGRALKGHWTLLVADSAHSLASLPGREDLFRLAPVVSLGFTTG